MSDLATITDILTLPGLSGTTSNQLWRPERAGSTLGETVSIGLVLDGERVAWGTCQAAAATGFPEHSGDFRAIQGTITIQEVVAPQLKGEPLSRFRPLAAQLENLTETVTVTRTLPQPEPKTQTSTLSRRDLLTGRLRSTESSAAGTRPLVEQVNVERPIHAAVRFGVSQALLAAVAMTQDVAMTEVIVTEYGLRLPKTTVPIHAAISKGQLPVPFPQVASLGYATLGADPESELGNDGIKLQQFVRELSGRISKVAHPNYCPAIHLNVCGGLGQLYENNAGKILGALYGLQQAAAPYPVRVEDPVLMKSRDDQMGLMKQLHDYLRLRRMSVQLVASAWISGLDDVHDFLKAEAVHVIRLVMPRLGSIHQTVTAIQACQERDVGVLLDGAPAELVAQVALATRPSLLAAPSDRPDERGITAAHDEMARTLALLALRE